MGNHRRMHRVHVPRPSRRLALLVPLLLVCQIAQAAAPAPATAKRVLPPGLDGQIEATFARAAPEFSLADGKIGAASVRARVCGPTGQCAELILGPPASTCAGERLGPWCVMGLARLHGDVTPLRRALRADPVDAFWRTISDPPRQSGSHDARGDGHDRRPPARSPASIWLALLVHGLLATAGWAVGLACRHRFDRRKHAATLVLCVVTPGAALLASDAALAWLDLWDAVTWAGALTLGAGLGVMAPRTMAAGMVAAGLSLGLVSTEVAVRALLPAPPRQPPLGHSPLHRPNPHITNAASRTWEWEDHACRLLLADGEASAAVAQLAADRLRPGRRKVLHLGDSMVHGMSVPATDTVVGRLDAATPGTGHVSVGMPGTSVDAALLAFRRWQPLLRPDVVVYHVFPGNDLDELDRPLSCCPAVPLLDRTRPMLPAQCTAESARKGPTPTRMLQHLSPAPYAVRAAAQHSSVAGWLRTWLGRTVHGSPLAPKRRWPAYVATLMQLIEEGRAAHVTLVLVIMPDRDALTHPTRGAASLKFAADVRGLARDRGVLVHDAGAHFRALATTTWSGLFLNELPGDIHLSPAGHAELARWLAPRLVARPLVSEKPMKPTTPAKPRAATAPRPHRCSQGDV